MLARPSNGNIRPKLSTMPRQKTEAAAYLDMYKLAIEKKRLLQELQTMEQRRTQIHQRLAVLENQMTIQEISVQHLRENLPADAQVPIPVRTPESTHFDTLFLEY